MNDTTGYDPTPSPLAKQRTLDYEAGQRALAAVLEERERQEAKWGQQNHNPFTYLTILMEEVGELSQAALHARFGGHAAEGLMEEAVQTAAVALAIVECLERKKWAWAIEVPCLDQSDLGAALGKLISRIELCGASPALTDAVVLAADLRQAVVGSDAFAAERVRAATRSTD